MPAGRPRKPTALKVAAGTNRKPKKGTEPRIEPQPDAGVLPCPDHLDAVAAKEWGRITAHLLALGLLTVVDHAAIAAYCLAWSRWVEAEKQVTKNGLVEVGSRGQLTRSPYVDIANAAMGKMLETMREFGMTPSSRSKVAAVKPQQTNDAMEYLA